MDVTCSFQVDATLIANEFIDRYMAEASGEYVKVYLYLLRHQQGPVELGEIADALNHTEADVKRALAYWEKLGALCRGRTEPAREDGLRRAAGQEAGQRRAAGQEAGQRRAPGQQEDGLRRAAGQETGLQRAAGQEAGLQSAAGAAGKAAAPRSAIQPGQVQRNAQSPAAEVRAVEEQAAGVRDAGGKKQRQAYSQEQVNRLQGDGDFSQLLYIAQRYLNKIFTPRELEVFAYLYDGLHMSQELLEYLVEYCVQNGHTSIRYIETVALSWHQRGLGTVEEAKAHASGFTKDSFSVMRAFGLTDRGPGDAEKEMIERWFHTYGFTRELVLEACNRTMEATHNPSFRYADKILADWKKAGVKNLGDVSALDEKHKSQRRPSGRPASARPANQFHNFEQRNTDYDSMVLDQVRDWIGGQ